MRALVLILLAAVAACGKPGDTVIDVVFDPCAPVVLVPADGTTPTEREALVRAIDAWNAVLPTGLVVEPAEGARLPVRFEDSAPLFHGVYLDEEGEILINRGLAGTAREITVAHELGHAFGLWHVDSDERRSVMNPGNLSRPPDEADARALRELWGRCPERAITPGAAHLD